MTTKRRLLPPAARLALLYLAFSTAWILLTDRAAFALSPNERIYNDLQQIKGIVFVLLSSILLFTVTHLYYTRLRARYRDNRTLLRRYQLLNEATHEATVDYDFASGSAVVNKTMRVMMDEASLSVPQFIQKHLARVHPDDRERVAADFQSFSRRSDERTWSCQFRYRYDSESYHELICRGVMVRLPDERPAHLVFSLQDQSEINEVRAQLLEQEVQFQQQQARAAIAAEESERERWALELHDNVCQLLTAAGLSLHQVPGGHPMQQRAQELLQLSLNEIRHLSATIKPPVFAEDTLEEALQTLIIDMQRLADFQCRLHLEPGLELRLQPEHKLMLYRIAQEQLNNTIKYADASAVSLSVSTRGNEVFLGIVDNGKGFDTEKKSGGIGLRNIRSRLQVFSGRLALHSAPGKGCTLEARFRIT